MISRRTFFSFLAGGAALLGILWPPHTAKTEIVTGTTIVPFDCDPIYCDASGVLCC